VKRESYGKIPSIRFTLDDRPVGRRRFTENGVLILYHEYIDYVNPANIEGSGRYKVKNNTVHFNCTDRRKIKTAFWRVEYDIKNQSPAS